MKKIVLLLVFILNFCFFEFSFGESNLENAKILSQKGIIENNSSGDFNLNGNISRTELLKIVLKANNISINSTDCKSDFKDVDKGFWGCKYISKALELNYISKNNTFRPNDNISQAEALKIIFKSKNISIKSQKDNWEKAYFDKYNQVFSKNITNNSISKREFVFDILANYDNKIKNNCNQIKTYAKTPKGECVVLENSCIPNGFKKVNNCNNKTTYNKPKIFIGFNQDMNKTSVLSNLKIYPKYSYTANWKDDKSLELTINDFINKETDFLVNVLDEALTQENQKIDKTIIKTFKISGVPTIEFVSPNGFVSEKNQNITIKFSKPMVSLTDFESNDFCPLEIFPKINGKCVWITTQTMQFRPENGLAKGAKYSLYFPVGIPSISGEKTIESRIFEIYTPNFELTNKIEKLNPEDKLTFIFNDEVDLESFKNNFFISGFDKEQLNISYLKDSLNQDILNTITVYPKTGNWGFEKTYSYNISKNLTSKYGNIGLLNDINQNLQTSSFLDSYKTVNFLNKDKTSKNYFNQTNLVFGEDNNIILNKNPVILLSFLKEFPLDKSLINSSLPFEMNYLIKDDYDNSGEKSQKIDKTNVILTFSGSIDKTFSFSINYSKYLFLKTLNFNTFSQNKIISYKQIDYSTACLVTKDKIDLSNENLKNFLFSKGGKIISILDLSQNYYYDQVEDCKKEAGKNKYLISTIIDPNSNHTLTIKKDLLSSNFYSLDKDYVFSFKTLRAKNEDKSIFIQNENKNILVPKNIKPLFITTISKNLNKVNLEICQSDIDVDQEFYQDSKKECVYRVVSLKNNGFNSTISTIDLEKAFGKTFTKQLVSARIEKIDSDKTDYEKKYSYEMVSTFLISDFGAVLKTGNKNNLLWLYDFSNNQNLTDKIQKIETYKKEAKTTIFNTFDRYVTVLVDTPKFEKMDNGLYSFDAKSPFELVLITLKDNSKIVLDNLYSSNFQVYKKSYIHTDKPIYDLGEKIEISGLSKIFSSNGIDIDSSEVNLNILNSRYQNIYSKKIKLNEFGAFADSFEIPKDEKYGTFTIQVGNDSKQILVEKFQKPDFKVESKTDKQNYFGDQKVNLDIFGEYYIKLPVSFGEGKYELKSGKYYFDGGKTSGYFWGENKSFWDFYRTYEPNLNFIGEKSFMLGADGKANILVDSDLGYDALYEVSTTITDSKTKKSISNTTSFIKTKSSDFFGLKFDKYFYSIGDTADIGYVSTDIEGNKISNKTANFKIYKKGFGDNEEKTLLKEDNISTNQNGIGNLQYTFKDFGEYTFEITNGLYTTTKTFYVYSNTFYDNSQNNSVEIVADKDSYSVGENANISINSPTLGAKALLTIEKNDLILSKKIIDISKNNISENILITKEMVGGFNIGIYIVKSSSFSQNDFDKLKNINLEIQKIEQTLSQNDKKIPYVYLFEELENQNIDKNELLKLYDLKKQQENLLSYILPQKFSGNQKIKVNSDYFSINSQVKLDKINFSPAEKQTIELYITDKSGKPISGEAQISIIDESILALKNDKTNLIDYFYENSLNYIYTFGNFDNILKYINFQEENNKVVETSNNQYSVLAGYATAEMASDDMLMSVEDDLSDKKSSTNSNANLSILRENFKDSFFNKTIKIIDGKAVINIDKLPDNLTTWVISGYVYDKENRLGNFEKSFVVSKQLNLLPQIPEFFTQSDETNLAVLAINNTDKELKTTIEINSTNLELSKKREEITIKPNSSQLVSFQAKVLPPSNFDYTNYFSEITFSISSQNLSDSLKLKRKIFETQTKQTVFTNGFTKDLSFEENIDFTKIPTDSKNNLKISFGANLLTDLFKDKTYIYGPYYFDIYSSIDFVKNYNILKNIYQKSGKIDEFENIYVYQYNQDKKITQVYNQTIELLKKSYSNGEIKNYFSDKYSQELNLEYLLLNQKIDGIDNNAILDKYFSNLQTKSNYFSPRYLLPLVNYKNDFIKNYKFDYQNFSDFDKIDYINLMFLSGIETELSQKYYEEFKNNIFIEARGSALKGSDSLKLSAEFANLLMTKKENQPLLLDNLIRYVIYNKSPNQKYQTEILQMYLNYINANSQTSFDAKAYLDNKEIFSIKFDEKNKFDYFSKDFNFLDYNISKNKLGFEKTGTGNLYYDVEASYYLNSKDVKSRDEGIIVNRNYFDYDEYNSAYKTQCYNYFIDYCFQTKIKNINPIFSSKKGQKVVGEVEIILPIDRSNIEINDYIPSGAVVLNSNFDTTSIQTKNISQKNYFDFSEITLNGLKLYSEYLPAGSYKFTYVMQLNNSGKYFVNPASAVLSDKSEIWGRSNGVNFEVKE